MRLPDEAESRREFSKLSPEKQIDVYLATVSFEPPPLAFEDYVAANWKVVLPVVKRRLATESGRKLLSLVSVLRVISEHHCSLSNRGDLLSEATAAIPRTGKGYRTWAEEEVGRIQHPTKILPPCYE